MNDRHRYQAIRRLAGGVAIVFGLLTVVSGGLVLFGGEQALQLAGNVVSFVLWFNFLAGFGYVLAGLGLLRRKRWAYRVFLALVTGTVVVLSAFSLHVLQGGAYEIRTVVALGFRTAVLLLLTWIAAIATANP
ncbi:hypothetical protein [Roseibium sp. Sym1]|uniref:hypothetical protein n=1 Tax=Roseibium sp. Sym1 TaxID=3016006 RepID=UPI0022B3A762|nr:hypothetical protein [Roseibium sp. Sym1]